MHCISCGFENPASARFCQECGARLIQDRPTAAGAPVGSILPEGERRQLTVMFSDLIGSTALSARLDPEEWRDIVMLYQRTATEAVGRFGGYVAQYQGDGIIVFFGYPEAHEDDAVRAVRGGLEILARMEALNHDLEARHSLHLTVRVGIHTGLVIVDPQGVGAGLVYGETPNLAARIQTMAEPNTLYISAATHQLVAGLFVVQDDGFHQLKGVPNPVQLYRVLQPSGGAGRLRRASGQLAPFVGREQERHTLMDRWQQAQHGTGQLVLITGEAGIGKSRLLYQFKADLGGTPHTWLECSASPYQQNTPFAPLIDLLQHAFQWSPDTFVEARVDALEQALTVSGFDPAETVPLVAPLLGLPMPARFAPLLLTPEQQRRRLIETLVEWLFSAARQQPTVFAVEDLHWADPSTLEVLGRHAERGATSPVLYLFTARPQFHPPWELEPHHTTLLLQRLQPHDVRAMITGLIEQFTAPLQTVETVMARTDGVPLFVEELTRELLDTGLNAARLRHVPATLHDLLMARLDRLGPAKEVAQVGAVLGRAFSYPLLQAVAALPEAMLQAALARLLDTDLVHIQEQAAEATYVFKHVLVQDAAYASLLKTRRRELHKLVARALSEQFPEIIAAQPELLAQHYSEAGEVEAALRAWQQAGELAMARAALVEAIQHYTRALELLVALPDTPERAQQELVLYVWLGRLYEATAGFGSSEAARSFDRARQIADRLDSPQLFFVLMGLWNAMSARSHIRAGQELADQTLRMAERDGGTMLLTWAYHIQAIQQYMWGNHAAAWEQVVRVLAQYREEEHLAAPFNPKISVLVHGVLALWHLGLADQARQRNREQLALAQRPGDIAMAHLAASNLYLYLREPELVRQHAEQILAVAGDPPMPFFQAWGMIGQAWWMVQQGQHAEGIARLRQALQIYVGSGARSSLSWCMGILAEAYLEAGATAEGLATIEEAFTAAPEEEVHLPELLRIRGDLQWKHADSDAMQKAGASYREALAVARRQGAKMQELRAVTRLSRLLQAQGRATEAHNLLVPLYASFTEGFDIRDLREARALLRELEQAGGHSGQ